MTFPASTALRKSEKASVAGGQCGGDENASRHHEEMAAAIRIVVDESARTPTVCPFHKRARAQTPPGALAATLN